MKRVSIFIDVQNIYYTTKQIFKSNFWITTSGFFSNTALELCLKVLDTDRILFAIDWPYASNQSGVNWLKNAPIDAEIKAAIFYKNAQKLLKV